MRILNIPNTNPTMSQPLLRYICIFIHLFNSLQTCIQALEGRDAAPLGTWEGWIMNGTAITRPARQEHLQHTWQGTALSPWHPPCWSLLGFEFVDDFNLAAGWDLSMPMCTKSSVTWLYKPNHTSSNLCWSQVILKLAWVQLHQSLANLQAGFSTLYLPKQVKHSCKN